PRTKELFLTGRNLDAERAEKIGLVHEVVDDAELERAALELAAEIAANAPLSIKGNKHAIDTLNSYPRLTPEQEQELIERREPCFRSEDFGGGGAPPVAEERGQVWRGRHPPARGPGSGCAAVSPGRRPPARAVDGHQT